MEIVKQRNFMRQNIQFKASVCINVYKRLQINKRNIWNGYSILRKILKD